MSIRRSSIVIGAVGVALIAVAAVIRFVIVPVVTKLPGDTNLGVKYSGTASLLDSAALAKGDLAHVLATNVPVSVDRTVKVTSTHGDTAILADTLNVHAGALTLPSTHVYSLDRTTLAGVTAPSGVAVEPSNGALSSAFPIGPKTNNSYRYYDSTTQLIVPVTYTGTDTRGGRDVNVYTMSATGPVKDAGLLKLFPPALPKALIASLGPVLPASLQAKLTPATVAALPEVIPLSYTGITTITAYVDAQTGVAIDQSVSQQVILNLNLSATPLAVMPALAMTFHITPASVASLADTAASAGLLLTVAKVILPGGLILLGLALIVVAVLRRRPPTTTDAVTNADSATDTGAASPTKDADSPITDSGSVATKFPATTVAATTVPSATVPSATVPSATVPSATVPSATVPSATVPSATLPSATSADSADRPVK